MTGPPRIREIEDAERPQIIELLIRNWGSPQIVSRGQIHDASEAPALGAFDDDRLIGLATYRIDDDECELLTLDALEPNRGIGSELLSAVAERARSAACHRLWLITTNDNKAAIDFYKRRGLKLVAIHKGAADEARRLKPEIPEFAQDGTRITDELEFDLAL